MRKLIFVLIFLFSFSFGICESLNYDYQFTNIKKDYKTVLTKEGKYNFNLVNFSNSFYTGLEGQPVLPYYPVQILLPQGKTIDSISVKTNSKPIVIEDIFLAPKPKEYPLSYDGDEIPSKMYDINKTYPENFYGKINIQNGKGYRIAYINLFPVKYFPSEKRIEFYQQLNLDIKLKSEDKESKILARNNNSDLNWIKNIVNNPEVLSTYKTKKSFTKDKSVDYYIITNNDFASYVGENDINALISHKSTFGGLNCEIKTVESIYAEYPGVDNQEKIRNFITSAYNNNNTEYILLVGDGDQYTNIVPGRILRADCEGYTGNIVSDFYYGCLDGTFDNNGNSVYGEDNDGETGGLPDMVAEVYVGRLSVDSYSELTTFIKKIIHYELNASSNDYAKKAYMLGELLWDSPNLTWGADYKDEIRLGASTWGHVTAGFPEDWNVQTLYDKDLNKGKNDSKKTEWSKTDLINLFNQNNTSVYNHLGHCSNTYMARLYNSDIPSITNTNLFVIYSQGCYPGAYDNVSSYGGASQTDCFSEQLTGNSEFGAVAILSNSRYGWGEYQSTDGTSQYCDRQFFDAIFSEDITNLGKINQDSKEDIVHFLTAKPSLKWIIWQVNLFGCPQTRLAGTISSKGSLGISSEYYSYGKNMDIVVQDLDLNTNPTFIDTCQVTVTTSSGDSETVTLSETSASSCTFSASITVRGETVGLNNNQIEGSHDSLITIEYVDANNGTGFSEVNRKNAHIDICPPTIYNVYASNNQMNKVTINWEANENSKAIIRYDTVKPLTSNSLMAEVSSFSKKQNFTLDNLTPGSEYYYEIISIDKAGNEKLNNLGGEYYTFKTYYKTTVFQELMNTDPNWNITGSNWAFGVPEGDQGDPSQGFTGSNVYGVTLTGEYPSDMNEETLTTPSFDCSVLSGATLKFYRWLGVEKNTYDHAKVQISTDGSIWTDLWENPSSDLIDTAWSEQIFDISSLADGQSTVYIRWVMGESDGSIEMSGWNIDDVEVFASSEFISPELEVFETEVTDSNNNIAEIGETINLKVKLKNLGLDATDVTGILSSNSSSVNILSNSVIYGDILQNSMVNPVNTYEIEILENADNFEDIPFKISWQSAKGTGDVEFTLSVKACSIEIVDINFDDTTDGTTVEGNGNGIPESGETVKMNLIIRNSGRELNNLSLTLNSTSTDLTIIDNEINFDLIESGEVLNNINTNSAILEINENIDTLKVNFNWTSDECNGSLNDIQLVKPNVNTYINYPILIITILLSIIIIRKRIF